MLTNKDVSGVIITSKTNKNIVLNSTAVCIELFQVGIISVLCSCLHRVQVQVMMNKSVKTEFRTTKPVQCRGLQYTVHILHSTHHQTRCSDLEMWVRGHSRSLKVVLFESSEFREERFVISISVTCNKNHDGEIWHKGTYLGLLPMPKFLKITSGDSSLSAKF